MGLGKKGQQLIKDTPKVTELFRATVAQEPAAVAVEKGQQGKGRPRNDPAKAKTFMIPLELNKRLRRFAFENEIKEVDVVRAALVAYLDANE